MWGTNEDPKKIDLKQKYMQISAFLVILPRRVQGLYNIHVAKPNICNSMFLDVVRCNMVIMIHNSMKIAVCPIMWIIWDQTNAWYSYKNILIDG